MSTCIILFDIDQTLLYSGGAGSLAMRRAFLQLYGIEDGFSQVESSGRTDWAILREGMRQHGLLNGKDHFRREMERFQATYHRLLEPTLYDVKGGHALPGVPKLLNALSERDDVRIGLATGNFRHAAFIKLRHFGLDGYLSEGGFGDDAEDRNHVIRVAIKRLANGNRINRDAVWVIGDTPLDVEAARVNRVRSLGVATGSSSTRGLRAAGADLVMVDLSRTEAVLEALLA